MSDKNKKITVTEAQLDALIDERVKKAMKADKTIQHSLTQDQVDILSIVAPGKLKRHQYEVAEAA